MPTLNSAGGSPRSPAYAGEIAAVSARLVGHTGQVAPAEELDALGVEHVGTFVRAQPPLARRPAPVVKAVAQVRPGHPIDRAELVADAQEHGSGHVPAGGLASDEKPLRAELGTAVVEQPPRDRNAVVRPGGEGMLGCQAVVHGHDSHPMAAAELEVPRIVHLGRTHHHPATVEVQVDGSGGAVGPEHPQHGTPPISLTLASGTGW